MNGKIHMIFFRGRTENLRFLDNLRAFRFRMTAGLLGTGLLFFLSACSNPAESVDPYANMTPEERIVASLIDRHIPAANQQVIKSELAYDTIFLHTAETPEEQELIELEMDDLYSQWVDLQPPDADTDKDKWNFVYLYLRSYFDLPAGVHRVYDRLILESRDDFGGIDIVAEMMLLLDDHPDYFKSLQMDKLFDNAAGDLTSTEVLETVLSANGVMDLSQYFRDQFKGQIAYEGSGAAIMESNSTEYTDLWEYHLKPHGRKTIILLKNESNHLIVAFTDSRFLATFDKQYAAEVSAQSGVVSNVDEYVRTSYENVDNFVYSVLEIFPQSRDRLKTLIDSGKTWILYDRTLHRKSDKYLDPENILVTQYYQYNEYVNYTKGFAAVGGGPGVMMCAYTSVAYNVVAHELMHWGDQHKILIVPGFEIRAFTSHRGSTELFQVISNISYEKDPASNTSPYQNSSYTRFTGTADWEGYVRNQAFTRYFLVYMKFLDEGVSLSQMGRDLADFSSFNRQCWVIGHEGWGNSDTDPNDGTMTGFLSYAYAAHGGSEAEDQHEQGTQTYYGMSLEDHENSIYQQIAAAFGSGTVYGMTESEWLQLYQLIPDNKKGKIAVAIRQSTNEFDLDYSADVSAAIQTNSSIASWLD